MKWSRSSISTATLLRSRASRASSLLPWAMKARRARASVRKSWLAARCSRRMASTLAALAVATDSGPRPSSEMPARSENTAQALAGANARSSMPAPAAIARPKQVSMESTLVANTP
ncbi:hypothetical protein [Acidovorax sp.]|uniref:hypothetical protein n=1 Tax=Acidovorax sp. TaxID=1872122 RepID=UPI00391F41D8